MIGEQINIDDMLKSIQTGRKGSSRFNAATADLMRLATLADEKNQPERAQKAAAAKAQGKPDLTPEWRGVLHYFIDGIRSRRNPESLRNEMLQNLRDMAEYAQQNAGGAV